MKNRRAMIHDLCTSHSCPTTLLDALSELPASLRIMRSQSRQMQAANDFSPICLESSPMNQLSLSLSLSSLSLYSCRSSSTCTVKMRLICESIRGVVCVR